MGFACVFGPRTAESAAPSVGDPLRLSRGQAFPVLSSLSGHLGEVGDRWTRRLSAPRHGWSPASSALLGFCRGFGPAAFAASRDSSQQAYYSVGIGESAIPWTLGPRSVNSGLRYEERLDHRLAA